MVRTIPPERFAQLIDAATKTFVARGYRLTQMSDIAEALGVAKGTLYGYVESKETLFDAAIRYADGRRVLPEPGSLPLATPPEGTTVEYIQARLMEEARELELVRVLSTPGETHAQFDTFARVVRDLYQRMWRNRHALKLVDRCAVDHPELAAVWFEQGRYGQVALLTTFIEQQIAAGYLRPLQSVPLAARMVLETIALWAIHMPWDPSPRFFEPEQVENAVVDMLVHAYARRTPHE